MLYGPTNEEMITDIFRAYVRSYRDLPLNLYHIQWKFRDEVRPRFGVMRGREFLMKDAYSFDLDYEGARHAYNRMFVAYLRTFARLGLKAIPMRADSGPIGGDLSHEFVILADTGESAVFCDKTLLDLEVPGEDTDFRSDLSPIVERWTAPYAATDEKHDEAAFAALPEERRVAARGIEVGHIFYFGTKYSEPMRARVTGPDGAEHAVHMGSYGVGVSRLVAAIIEASHDDAGIIWPDSVAPFSVGLINLKPGDEATDEVAEGLDGAARAGRNLRALRRYRPARRSEIRFDGPDRASLAAHRRAARRARAAKSRSSGARRASARRCRSTQRSTGWSRAVGGGG